MIKHKLSSLVESIEYLKSSISDGTVQFSILSDAPFWLRLFARGTYCAYGNTVYAPEFHLALVSSSSEVDRTLATAKILPHVMLIHDFKKVSVLTFLKSKFSNSYKFRYFLYEFLFLKYSDHKMLDTIAIGFMVTRRNWYGKRLTFDEVQTKLNDILLR